MSEPVTSEFAVGDVVQLKSGGPLMTVNAMDPSQDAVECAWFANDWCGQRELFDRRALRKPQPFQMPLARGGLVGGQGEKYWAG